MESAVEIGGSQEAMAVRRAMNGEGMCILSLHRSMTLTKEWLLLNLPCDVRLNLTRARSAQGPQASHNGFKFGACPCFLHRIVEQRT